MINKLSHLYQLIFISLFVQLQAESNAQHLSEKSYSNCYAICINQSDLIGANLPNTQGYFMQARLNMFGEISRPSSCSSSYTLQ